MKKLFIFILCYAGILYCTNAQESIFPYVELNVQLKEGGNPKRDIRYDLEIEILRDKKIVYKETQRDKYTNYDGFIHLKIGSGTPVLGTWAGIDWIAQPALKVKINGRPYNAFLANYNELYPYDGEEGYLPITAYAHYTPFVRPGVGSIGLFTNKTHPNIELQAEALSNNYPYIDFSQKGPASDPSNNLVARIEVDSRKFLSLRSRGGRTYFTSDKPLRFAYFDISDDVGLNLGSPNPFINFGEINDQGSLISNAKISYRDDSKKLSIYTEGEGRNIVLDAGNGKPLTQKAEIEYLASKHEFVGGPIIVDGSGKFGVDDYTYLGYRDISPSDLGLGIYYGINCDCGSDGSYVPFNTNDRLGTGSGDPLYSIKTSQGIKATYFHAYSDKRMKTIAIKSKIDDDLNILKKLNTSNFYYKDLLKNGNKLTKGFIAQEVEQVFPNAISYETGVVPDIFQVGKDIAVDDNLEILTVTVDSLNNLVVGEKVKLIGKSEYLLEVIEREGTTFKVKGWPEKGTKEIFVYGREVSDFRTVDYDQIFTLNVAATQELIKEVETLKSQIALLKSDNLQLKDENKTLHSKVDTIGDRLDALIMQLSNAKGLNSKENK